MQLFAVAAVVVVAAVVAVVVDAAAVVVTATHWCSVKDVVIAFKVIAVICIYIYATSYFVTLPKSSWSQPL